MVQTRAGNMSSANVVIKAACAINQLIYNLQCAQPAGYIFVLWISIQFLAADMRKGANLQTYFYQNCGHIGWSQQVIRVCTKYSTNSLKYWVDITSESIKITFVHNKSINCSIYSAYSDRYVSWENADFWRQRNCFMVIFGNFSCLSFIFYS